MHVFITSAGVVNKGIYARTGPGVVHVCGIAKITNNGNKAEVMMRICNTSAGVVNSKPRAPTRKGTRKLVQCLYTYVKWPREQQKSNKLTP